MQPAEVYVIITIMIAKKIKALVESPSAGVIRKMFEEGSALKAKYGEDKVFDFSIGNPDIDPPSKVIEAIKKVCEEEAHLCHGYMPNAGYLEARKAMADKTSKEQGVPVDFSNVVMSERHF